MWWISQAIGWLTCAAALGLWRQAATAAGSEGVKSIEWKALLGMCYLQAAARGLEGVSGLLDPSLAMMGVRVGGIGALSALGVIAALGSASLSLTMGRRALSDARASRVIEIVAGLAALATLAAVSTAGMGVMRLINATAALSLAMLMAHLWAWSERHQQERVRKGAKLAAVAGLLSAGAALGLPGGGAVAAALMSVGALVMLHGRILEITRGRVEGISPKKAIKAWAVAVAMFGVIGFGLAWMGKPQDASFEMFAWTFAALCSTLWIANHFTTVGRELARFIERVGEERSRALLMGVEAAAFLIDEQGRILDCSASAEVLAQQEKERMLGASVWEKLGVRAREASWFEQRSDHGLDLRVSKASMGADLPGVSVVTARDVTEEKKAQKALEKMATEDELTGLPNRRAGLMKAQSLCERGERFALLFMDLDHFKNVNDAEGHGAGDELLREVGALLDQTAQEFGGWVARVGGDEFLALMIDASEERCEEVGAALMASVERSPRARAGSVGMSVGAAMYPRDGETAADLLRRADAAMYEAKQNGRGRMAFFGESIEKALRRRVQVESFLREALRSGEGLDLWLQPIVSMDGAWVGEAEALIRAPGLPGCGAQELIEVAEKAGLIAPVGRWVLERSAQVGKAAAKRGFAMRVSLNVSAQQFMDDQFWAKLRELCEGSAAPQFCLEMTETALLEDVDRSRELLAEAKKMGCQVALDDFGVGYSSLSMLRAVPLDKIKIDKSLIDKAPGDADSAAVARAALAMASALGLGVVVEGVERQEQASWLAQCEVIRAQGYLFARPMSQSALWEWVAERDRKDRKKESS